VPLRRSRRAFCNRLVCFLQRVAVRFCRWRGVLDKREGCAERNGQDEAKGRDVSRPAEEEEEEEEEPTTE